MVYNQERVSNQEWLILQTIYVLNKNILQSNPPFIIKSGFKSRGGYNTVTVDEIPSDYNGCPCACVKHVQYRVVPHWDLAGLGPTIMAAQ